MPVRPDNRPTRRDDDLLQDSRDQRLALDNCDREPIHTPGVIQPFGAVLACDLRLGEVLYASANLADITGIDHQKALGTSTADLLGPELAHAVRNALSASTSAVQRERVGVYEMSDRQLDFYCHRNAQGLVVIEIETVPALSESHTVAIDRVRALLAQITARSNLADMLKFAVTGLHQITGYDRVKAYRYMANGDGEVVAEFCVPGVESFLGLRYPAWDVPTQARALQIKSPLRILPDVEHTPAPIVANAPQAEPLDLSLAHVRGVSPIHLEYLRNMGVTGTLSLGIVVDGKLWGMFAGHHMEALELSPETRMACELFTQMFSLIVHKAIELKKSEAREAAAMARHAIISATDRETDLLDGFENLAPILKQVIDCDGLAVLRERDVRVIGSTPSKAALLSLAHVQSDEDDLIETCEHLLASPELGGKQLGNSAGMLLVRATAAYPLQLAFFRDETLRKLTWAGKPDKAVTVGKFGPRLSPRGSFEAYAEERRDHSDPWTDEDVAAARELQVLLTQIAARGERSQAEQNKSIRAHQRQQDILIAELNHRVKNILGLIKSVVSQARHSASSVEAYAEAVEMRINALANAHDLATTNTLQGVPLRRLLETEMAPYLVDQRGRVLLDGPAVGLKAGVAPMLSMVFHELATNASKYGALSVDDGLVRVVWSRSDEGLEIRWSEMNGPPVSAPDPDRPGFGRSLIEQAVPFEFDGTAKLEFGPGGVSFRCFLPEDTLADITDLVEPERVAPVIEIRQVAAGRRALLVEDNVVLAMDTAETLRRLGCEKVTTVGSSSAAEALLDKGDYDLAVLDMNLRGSTSYALGSRLRGGDVPIVFVTGYGTEVRLPDDLAGVPVLAKPLSQARLSHALHAVLNED
ncbi:hypothetical protein BV394_03070 [Brevirhabdus pacifica]|uniref:histidine kinase n=1 Tax=Brevirhabdus pacifica TaxID=1267768 RepID=A0A1U7DFR5_9RHOB|nr:HWE histidine kinase domain-containing protein [Brevirhabdus pacifica]APX88837.1 hypothetical protein BV394_03070 [Brevirhabdus pacifica]OWU80077.1 hypothetical protein ATO5_03755 [Loktanella sp. 22II-4b]PJJ86627.1 light-regulated signal transduction histidine kinase (bacteriophytochrome) [Brevirhabdus pacifica]